MFDVIVVGGGLVGGSFALDLAMHNPNLNIALIDKSEFKFDQTDFDNRIYAINPSNLKYLTGLGIDLDHSRINNIEQMQVHGDGDSSINLLAKEIHQEYLAKTIEYSNLQKAIYAQIAIHSNIKQINANIQNIENFDEYVQLQLSSANTISGRIIVAADGANSFIRKTFAINTEIIDYNQSGVIGNLSVEKSHNNIAYQWFLPTGDILAFLPLPDNKISIVYSTHNPERLLNMPNAEFCLELENISQGVVGKICLDNKLVSLPIKLRLVEKFYANNMFLIGDAAHTIHPLAGQGVNLGFQDCKYLSAKLSSLKPYQFNDKAIGLDYHNARYLAVRKMQLTCHGLYRLFNAENNSLNKLRNFGLRLVNKSNYIKKELIRQAM